MACSCNSSCNSCCDITPLGPPTPTASMTLSEFIAFVLNYTNNLTPVQNTWIGSIIPYTPDIRNAHPTRAQIEQLAPMMRWEWAKGVFQGYIGKQIVYQLSQPDLTTVLTIGLASTTLVRLSSYQKRRWNFTYYNPTQYIELTDTYR